MDAFASIEGDDAEEMSYWILSAALRTGSRIYRSFRLKISAGRALPFLVTWLRDCSEMRDRFDSHTASRSYKLSAVSGVAWVN